MICLVTERDAPRSTHDCESIYQYLIQTEDIPDSYRTIIEEIPNNSSVIISGMERTRDLEDFFENVDFDELSLTLYKRMSKSGGDSIKIDKFFTVEM